MAWSKAQHITGVLLREYFHHGILKSVPLDQTNNHVTFRQFTENFSDMKILLLCTAHNSLSQRLYLTLTLNHEVTIEYALSTDSMIEAVTLAHPHLIICPFLTSFVPAEIYTKYMTLVVHPGAPGDGGPSALDFLIIGEDGTDDDIERVMRKDLWSEHGRSHWGVTVLQANAEYDAGPVWAWEQYTVNIDDHNLTKSNLYRGAVTRAALVACLIAIERIKLAAKDATRTNSDNVDDLDRINPGLEAKAEYKTGSATTGEPFLGGHTTPLPLLKAAQRDFDVTRHCALMISRLIRASDSQPGCLTKMFTPNLYIYGGLIEEGGHMSAIDVEPGTIIGIRSDTVCFKTVDGKGIWITHGRRVKRKTDPTLWPKVPAIPLFMDIGIIDPNKVPQLLPSPRPGFSRLDYPTFQEIFVEYDDMETGERVAYMTFNFYNGAMSTHQCHQMCAALRSILATHTESTPLSAVVLLGGTYFSNGIHLNVIEADADPAAESWANINAIDDVVLLILQDFAAREIITISALRGNAAAGGVALAVCADYVIASEEMVLNPAYRALGLFGSEYHTLTYYGRVGNEIARHLLRDMLPVSAQRAKDIGLVDFVLPGYGEDLDNTIHTHVSNLISTHQTVGQWKLKLDLSPTALATARANELGEMSKDFWSARSIRYHSRRRDFVRKIKPSKTPLRFAQHRRKDGEMNEEETDSFDKIESFTMLSKRMQEQAMDQTIEQLKMQARRASTPGTVVERDRRQLELMFSCYYNAG